MNYDDKFSMVGEAREIDIAPMDDTLPNKVVTIAYGTWTVPGKDGAADKVAHRFACSGVAVVEGRDVVVGPLYATDAAKNVNNMVDKLYAPFGVMHGDCVVDADFEDEFFSQKHKTVKVTDNVWAMPEYTDQLAELAELSSSAEASLSVANESSLASQDDHLAIGKIIMRVQELCKSDRKLMQSWAVKGDGASNHPLLARLGKGINALTEATRIARLTDSEYSVIPAGLTSGKGIERFASKSVEAMADAVASKLELNGMVKAGEKGDYLVGEGISAAVELIASEVYGVVVTSDMTMADIVVAIDAMAGEAAVSHSMTYGKVVNTYDATEYAAALSAYGKVTACSEGSGLIAKAVGSASDLQEGLIEGDAVALLKVTRGNLLLKHIATKAMAHQNAVAAEQRNRDLVKELEGEENPLGKKTSSAFHKLSAEHAAARLHEMVAGHADAKAVHAAYLSLVRQTPYVAEVEEQIAAE